LTVDIRGKPGHKPCWFNPDYRAWLVATMKDLYDQATCRAFDAGASGIVASREYEEIGIPSHRAVGRAVRHVLTD
jgi:hypothetical protein